jgi:hypothetical protein
MSAVCWHEDGRVRDGHFHRGARVILYGRCRSGRRWFWAVNRWNYDDNGEQVEHGYADTEQQAIDAARTMVERLAGGDETIAYPRHGVATRILKQVNAERRRARPAPDTADAGRVEYLYARDTSSCHWDGNPCGCDDLRGRAKWDYHVDRFRITKKTAKRIYYVRSERYDDEVEIGYVDRQKLEADGEVYNHGAGGWWSKDFHLLAAPPEPPTQPTPVDQRAEVSRLRAEMAAVHPDRGGTSAAFIEARSRYLAAKGRLA